MIEVERTTHVQVGATLPETIEGRMWQIVHVSKTVLFARAVPVDDD